MLQDNGGTYLHIKVISYIRNNHPNAILCAGPGELQDSSTK